MPSCRTCASPFTIRAEDLEFYERFDVPAPALCPDCRLQERLAFRNERTLYRRPSSLSKTPVISIYHPESPYAVYGTSEWWSDSWDAADYGRPFDFRRPFFEQFQELRLQVPRITLFNVNPHNSDYCQQAYDNKNCYLCVVLKDCEDSMYVSHSNKLRDCYDCSHMQHSELCYDCTDSDKLYACVCCRSCQNSTDLYFSYDCIGCQNCIGCSGLRNKRFHIDNEPVTKEAFQAALGKLSLDTTSGLARARAHYDGALRKRIHRESQNLNTESCHGNYLLNAKNAYLCFDAFEIQDCAYSTWIFESKDCHDIYGMGTSEVVYASLGVEKLNFAAFNTFVSHTSDVFYSDLCFYSAKLFGCVGLRNKRNSILNASYTADEYDTLKEKVIGHMRETGEWGKFFPASLSPFAYNETAAQEYFALTKAEAQKLGFRWQDPDKREYRPGAALPEGLAETADDVTNAILACSECKKNYKVVPLELAFYRKMRISLPRECHDCRYMRRAWGRNPRKLWTRECARCKEAIETSYAPARPEVVYCENCYREAAE